MKLVTLFVFCDIAASPLYIKEHLGKSLDLTIEDPQIVQDRKNLEKVIYWKDLEFSNSYSIDRLINELTSEFPQYVIFDITRPKPRFHEKNGWWLGILASVMISMAYFILDLLRN